MNGLINILFGVQIAKSLPFLDLVGGLPASAEAHLLLQAGRAGD
jgi:hypothetical protein